MSIVFVDILCSQSLCKIIKIKRLLTTVYYHSLSKFISPFIDFISRFTHIQFLPFPGYPSSKPYNDCRSCYEEIESRKISYCNLYLDRLQVDPTLEKFCQANQLDQRLAREHLRQKAYWLLHRPVEIMVHSELINNEDDIIYLFRKSPITDLLIPSFQDSNHKYLQYDYSGTKHSLVNRDDYIFNAFIEDVYFNNPLINALHVLRNIFLLIINSFCNRNFEKKNENRYLSNVTLNIGVDKYMNSAEDDFFWFEDSMVDRGNIYYFEERNPLKRNTDYLKNNNIKRIHIVNNPFEWFKKNDDGPPKERQLISAAWRNVRKSILSYYKQWFQGLTFFHNDEKWIIMELLELRISYNIWKDVLQKLGIKVLTSLEVVDYFNAAKTMAVNSNDGVILGGHLSNYPLYNVSTERFYHVAFAWGPHFKTLIYERYPYETIIISGYCMDHKFGEQFEKAEKIRKRYPGKFIITFMDNNFYPDYLSSEETIKDAYMLLLDIIESYPQVQVFVKSKREEIFEKARKVVPMIEKYINSGRVVIFIRDEETNQPHKATCIAMASDLVIGLGINSAATESQFAGIPSFHLDLSRTDDNKFAKIGHGIVVFQSVMSMKEAIKRQINPQTALDQKTVDKYYHDLDPFRDGRAAERIGNYIKWLMDGFNIGLSRESCLAHASKRYREDWGNENIVELREEIESKMVVH